MLEAELTPLGRPLRARFVASTGMIHQKTKEKKDPSRKFLCL